MTQSPSLPPAQEPGSRSFLIAALVMVALIVGLLAWKYLLAPAPAPAPPPAQKPVVARPPVLDEPPPPPPVEEAPPSPTPAPVAEQPAKPTSRRPTGCESSCSGEATPELMSALGARGGQSRSCYERALVTNGSLSGKLTVNVRVGPNGDVCSASIASDSLNDAAVTSCVLQRFRSARFPKPTGGCVDMAAPLNFVPRQ